jgi:Flp pilus assembly protein TadB
MNLSLLLGIAAGILALGSAGFILYTFLGNRGGSSDYRSLMTGDSNPAMHHHSREMSREDADLERVKNISRKAADEGVNKKLTFDEKLFQAGVFTNREKEYFARMKIVAPPLCSAIVGFLLWYAVGIDYGALGLIVGLFAGIQLPTSILERKAKRRQEDIMFYLPLVVEQISIGVSSSLDIGPCLQRVVQMADERDSHNVVTELLRHVQYHVKSGMGLEEALSEMGRLSGSTELKHTFVNLAQVAKHGGEISKQLQELADSVSSQRETRIEAKIKKLELEATGPVALVFLGFMIILLIGFGLQIQGAFG